MFSTNGVNVPVSTTIAGAPGAGACAGVNALASAHNAPAIATCSTRLLTPAIAAPPNRDTFNDIARRRGCEPEPITRIGYEDSAKTAPKILDSAYLGPYRPLHSPVRPTRQLEDSCRSLVVHCMSS